MLKLWRGCSEALTMTYFSDYPQQTALQQVHIFYKQGMGLTQLFNLMECWWKGFKLSAFKLSTIELTLNLLTYLANKSESWTKTLLTLKVI